MKGILERLAAGERLLADGAMGTMLMDRGLPIGACPEQINLDRPELLEEIARLYCEAGADIVLANTFGGSPLKLAQYDLSDQTEKINGNAVRAARRAVGDSTYVAASCGPCGHLLEPYGDVSPAEVQAGFERQLQAVAATGVDCICVETMTDLAEAVLAVRAARTVAPRTPITATMTFDATPSGFRTIMGTSVAEAVAGLEEAGADIVGSNCGHGIESLTEIAREFKRHTARPLLIQPNAGLPELSAVGPVYPETPDFMAERCGVLLDLGVQIIGGCCGTTPEHIAAMREALDRFGAGQA
jgi:5-methyltetrahydrofolate--homocysteine methyltransferase